MINFRRLSQLWQPQRYFFVHIPKTAGTSIRKMLYKTFPQQKIYPNLADIKLNKGYPAPAIVRAGLKSRLPEARIFMGHYPAALQHALPSKCITFTILREPIDRAMSHIFHMEKHVEPFKGLNFPQVFENMNFQSDNLQTRYMIEDTHVKKLLPEHFQEAKQRLESLDFVGITEQFTETVDRINNLFGWDLQQPEQRVNFNSDRDNSLLDADLIALIEAHNQWDILLYEEALKLFNASK